MYLKILRFLGAPFLLIVLASCTPTNTGGARGGAVGAVAPAIPDGSAPARITNGTSAIEIAREDPGFTYAAFRACVINTGEPHYEQRVYILRNRSNQTISTDVQVLGQDIQHWSVHTLRRAVLAPGDSFDVYVTFLPKNAGLKSLSLQITSRAGGSVLEAPVIELKGKGFDCREEEVIEEVIPVPEDEVPELLEPEEDTNNDEGTGGGTTTTPLTPATPTTTVIRPQDVVPPDQLLECPGIYTEAVTGWNYDRVPRPIGRLRPAVLNKVSAQYANLPALRATINYIKVTSVNTNPAPAQSMPWSDAQVRNEIRRTIRWYAGYCVLLTFRELSLRPADAQQLADKYDDWLRLLPQDLSMGLNDALSREGDNILASAVNAAKQVIPSRNEVTVLFMDRQVGYVGARLTQGSFAISGKNFLGIGLHGADRDDPYILSHELIHALGLRSKITWFHSSGDIRSMSRIIRRSINEAANLSESRLLDFAEYKVIMDARVVR